MIILLSIILIISVASLCWCIYFTLDIKKEKEKIQKTADSVLELYKTVSEINKDINHLKENPTEFTKRFALVDFQLKKMEAALEAFNNGFRYQESWMR